MSFVELFEDGSSNEVSKEFRETWRALFLENASCDMSVENLSAITASALICRDLQNQKNLFEISLSLLQNGSFVVHFQCSNEKETYE